MSTIAAFNSWRFREVACSPSAGYIETTRAHVEPAAVTHCVSHGKHSETSKECPKVRSCKRAVEDVWIERSEVVVKRYAACPEGNGAKDAPTETDTVGQSIHNYCGSLSPYTVAL